MAELPACPFIDAPPLAAAAAVTGGSDVSVDGDSGCSRRRDVSDSVRSLDGSLCSGRSGDGDEGIVAASAAVSAAARGAEPATREPRDGLFARTCSRGAEAGRAALLDSCSEANAAPMRSPATSSG